MSTPNNAYWLRRAGRDYAAQQWLRRRHNPLHSEYRCQEKWIASYLRLLEAQAGRRLRVLDFGCGFGRFREICRAHGFDYRGYDFSAAMVEPLVDGEGHFPPDIRVAASLDEAWPGEQFDVIFTVSVLIHNSPEQAAGLVGAMRRHLVTGGRLILVENKITFSSQKCNLWHSGCWTHDVATDLAPDMCLQIRDNVLDGQSIYILSEVESSLPQATYVGPGWRGPLSERPSEVSQMQPSATQLTVDAAELAGRMHDLEEVAWELKCLAARIACVDAISLDAAHALQIVTNALEEQRE